MNRVLLILVIVAIVDTVGALGVWVATDRHAYTKFEVVEQVEVPVNPDDPLAEAGFYEGGSNYETVRRKEFHLGLLPVPLGLFDKHIVSVATFTAPAWLAVALAFVWKLRRRKRTETFNSEGPGNF